MLNLHLNGEVVLTPDFVNIRARMMERFEKEQRCKYGIEEIKCNVWFNHCHSQEDVKNISKFGRCPFAFSDCCPLRRKRKETGLMKKNYGINNRTFRKMQSSAHYLIKSFDCKSIFMTLTFPQFKKYLQPNEANKLFSKFVHNLREKHGVNGYVAVRETGSKFGRLHFHLLINMPFIPFSDLNNYWCRVIRDYCEFAPNAVQVDPKNKFIKNPVRAMFYVTKYFAKSKNIKQSESRVYFISNNLLSEKFIDAINRKTGEIQYKRISNIKRTYNYSEMPINNLFEKYPSLVVTYQNEYTTGFKIATTKDFNLFCKDFLYKIFDLPDDNKPMLTG